MTERILLIDDHEPFCIQVQKSLSLQDINLEYITNSRDGLQAALEQDWDIILLDVVLSQQPEGLDILKEIVRHKTLLPVIMISGASMLHTAVEATKMGAYDFLEKPLDLNRLMVTIKRALEKKHLSELNKVLLSEVHEQIQFIGKSKDIENIFNEVDRIAATDTKVFIQGESGVGKDILAKIIHYRSHRKEYPFLSVNCGALPENLVESELFGYQKGAFTGAYEKKDGFIAKAEGGTLFLDEIAELPVTSQSKLLRFLNDGRYTPVGGTESIKSNVRVIAATNHNILEDIDKGLFRKDLFYRLNVVKIYIPPIRERKEDIVPLAEFFLQKACEKFGRKITHFSGEALHLIKENDWKGNARQLKSAVYRMVLYSSNHIIDFGTAASAMQMDHTNEMVISSDTYGKALKKFERLYIQNLLILHGDNLKEAAQSAALSFEELQEKLLSLNLTQNRPVRE